MIIRKGQKLGSVLVNAGEDEPKPKEAKKKAPAKKAEVKKSEVEPSKLPESTMHRLKGDED